MRIETDPFSQHLWHALRQKADLYKDTPPVTYTFTGRRLLAQSRRCLEHILTLAAAARLTGDRSYAARAIAEMRDVARFPDWNPSHYLDVAEMAAALAIGYDWLYDELTDADRDLVAGALELLALRPSFDGPRENLWWVEGTNNWNQVCHGGLSLAALAIAERRPELAQAVVQRALANIPRAAHSYAPDGAYAEGPTYWDYGTLYHVLLAAALERVTGSAQGLDEFPGFRESGDYIPQVTTPTGRLYCYSDADERRLFAIPLFWFARRFQCPELVRHELENLERYLDAYEKQAHNEDFRYLALALLWAPVPVAARPAAPRPLRWHARGVNPIAVFRSAWDDPAALFAGLKGGSPRDPHAHMDAGSYILEADGVRWALDLEKQDYAVIEGAGLALWDARQDADRWKVFRLGPDSHNILRFDGAAPCITGRAEFLHVETAGSMPRAVLDLDSLYAGQVASRAARASVAGARRPAPGRVAGRRECGRGRLADAHARAD
ncbi:MAG: heparinase [Verrucomicrobiota bacterium]